MSNPFYRSSKWKKKRLQILKRDGYACQECKKYGKNVDANIVHHLKEVEFFPELKLSNSNLQSVCAACHNRLHPEKGGRKW